MLAMVVNDNEGSLAPRGALRFFASMLAPTETAACRKRGTGVNRALRASGTTACRAPAAASAGRGRPGRSCAERR
ncbi:hypothetical protein PSUM_05230 [Pseudomonas umsongensis]|uniref:Uncharacterized protein n=1 Tax=Pseudomonas umsongensis TaxID=198618 RepID=A0ABX4E108_9PSED|nr:hypothetical protein [Pseudomonas umsongensis]OXR35290.1 hypothetical protein PSUM_05230 [Pseudomonas umsongensis]